MKTDPLLPSKYHNKMHLGVINNTNDQTFSFWPTSFTGTWPEKWSSELGSLTYNRQEVYKLLGTLAEETKSLGISEPKYPLGKNTHELKLVHHTSAGTNDLVGVQLFFNQNSKIKDCLSFQEIFNVQKQVGLHLGYLPKHKGQVSQAIVKELVSIDTGRITNINTNYLYGGTPENRTKKAFTAKVMFPYGGMFPFDESDRRLAKRFKQVILDEDSDSNA